MMNKRFQFEFCFFFPWLLEQAILGKQGPFKTRTRGALPFEIKSALGTKLTFCFLHSTFPHLPPPTPHPLRNFWGSTRKRNRQVVGAPTARTQCPSSLCTAHSRITAQFPFQNAPEWSGRHSAGNSIQSWQSWASFVKYISCRLLLITCEIRHFPEGVPARNKIIHLFDWIGKVSTTKFDRNKWRVK